MPKGLAPRGKLPTGAVCAKPSFTEGSRHGKFVLASAKFAKCPAVLHVPHGKIRPSPPRALYSHSASVGRR